MFEILFLYKWTLACGIVLGSALCLIGAQLASRNQPVQALVISQASSFGVVLGLISSHNNKTLPLIFSFILATLFYFICDKVISQNWPSRSTYHVGLFSSLLALTYTITALFPGLESHMAASFFGDLATVGNFEAGIGIVVGFIVIFFAFKNWRDLTRITFESTVFATPLRKSSDQIKDYFFIALSLIAIATSVQFLGLLFTLSSLFVPSLILARLHKGLKYFALKNILATSFGVSCGFVLSLLHSSIPTVPIIAIFLIVISLVIGKLNFKSR
jgi:zinc/manganese transport system permease protein